MLSFPAVIYAYYDVQGRYQDHEGEFPHEYMFYLSAALLIIIIINILTINTISFVNSRRIRNIKFQFKKELFECVCKQAPEIKKYLYYQKIHPRYFFASGLFKSVHTDYIGDDLFYGEYKGFAFEICELHVFKLFKQIFDGVFVRIKSGSSKISADCINMSILPKLDVLDKKYQIKAKFSSTNDIYLAFGKRGKFFENENIREISELEEDIGFLSDIVNLTKEIITCCYFNK